MDSKLANHNKVLLDNLAGSDDNKVWKAFIYYIGNTNKPDASDFTELSGRAAFALSNAFDTLGTMRTAVAQISAAETALASAFAEIEDDFIEHILTGSLSGDILVASSGPGRKIRDFLFVRHFKGLYFVGTNKAKIIAGPYSSLDKCLKYAWSYLRRIRVKITRIVHSEAIPTTFIDDMVINNCPVIGTRFTLNGKLCARSDDTPYVEVDF